MSLSASATVSATARVVALVAGFLGMGCHRSTSLEHPELERIEYLGEERVRVHYRNEKAKTYEYDRVIVHRFGHAPSQEFEDPVSAEVRDGSLRITGAASEERLALTDVAELELEEDAPDRPWVIAASTVGAAMIGALVGSSFGTCTDEWGCYEPTVYGSVGFLVGIPVGLALSIPLSGDLRPEREPRERK